MGEAFTKNPYTRGSANFEKVQKQIDSNSNTKSLITPPSEVTSALEIIDKPTGRSKGFRGSGGRNYPTKQQAVISQTIIKDPISEIEQSKPISSTQNKNLRKFSFRTINNRTWTRHTHTKTKC